MSESAEEMNLRRLRERLQGNRDLINRFHATVADLDARIKQSSERQAESRSSVRKRNDAQVG